MCQYIKHFFVGGNNYTMFKFYILGEYNLTAGIHVFNITCQDWMDEGFTNDSFSSQEPLFYMFFLSYGDASNDSHRQLLYFDRKTLVR